MNPIQLYSKVTERLYVLDNDERIKRTAAVYKALWNMNDRRLYGLVNTLGSDLAAFGCDLPNAVDVTPANILPLNFEYSDNILRLQYNYRSLNEERLTKYAKGAIIAIYNHYNLTNITQYEKAYDYLKAQIEENPALTIARLRVLLHYENVNVKCAVFSMIKTYDSIAQDMLDYIWYSDDERPKCYIE